MLVLSATDRWRCLQVEDRDVANENDLSIGFLLVVLSITWSWALRTDHPQSVAKNIYVIYLFYLKIAYTILC